MEDTMICKMCKERVKDWAGDDPTCYFDDPHNWNCATVNEIRDLCYEGQELKPGIHYEYCDDEKFATFNIHEVECEGNYIGRCLYAAWYKQRGSTEAIWILDGEGDTPRKPTEGELLAIIKYYKEMK
jgi:hypothetical protein